MECKVERYSPQGVRPAMCAHSASVNLQAGLFPLYRHFLPSPVGVRTALDQGKLKPIGNPTLPMLIDNPYKSRIFKPVFT